MSNVVRIAKDPLVEQPLKTSQATGAALAAMGLAGCVPLFHGSQGCCAFAKVYLIQHFREPMPFQNTAVDQISAVMGGDDSVVSALALIAEKHQPEMIMLMSTGLTEMQGCDLQRLVHQFYQDHPQFNHIVVVAVNSADFSGSLQSGYAAAVKACLEQVLLGPRAKPPLVRDSQRPLVTLLCSSTYNAADVELLQRYCDALGLDSIALPDLGSSLDGHLAADSFSPTSTGGTGLEQLRQLPHSRYTLVLGESLLDSAQLLEREFGTPYQVFGMGLASSDALINCLCQISGNPVPAWISRERRRLQDALLDTHFLLSSAPMALAAEPDCVLAYSALLDEIGVDLQLVVTTLNNHALKQLSAKEVVVGDLSALRPKLDSVELVLGNTHCANLCEPAVPVHRLGYPCHDRFGNSERLQLGYQGARARLFEMANLLKANHHDEVPAHHSPYRFQPEDLSYGGR
ncbi:nitrogenase iron-molybdenum cofactor biosynthesis protein NifN [Aliagarivorans taiwanensis]|uniref:nitrogenase iron-molybdenum cofactor biosynthesis protein NifN n=1 Tax=Aliagarivorans taiwanensis TaxID=561966 RepID=UPI0004209C6F|nr:nitrogenase iron-molybdenum cofactor biosynthesis protein NifN [Aliagarivorans taiwanensis]